MARPQTPTKLRKSRHDLSAEHIIKEVARAAQVQTADLLDRKTRLKVLRQIAIELTHRYTDEKHTGIGPVFGTDYSSESQNGGV